MTCGRRRVGLCDLLEEGQELGVAVAWGEGIGDVAGGDLQRGEQGGGAVADIVVGVPPRARADAGMRAMVL